MAFAVIVCWVTIYTIIFIVIVDQVNIVTNNPTNELTAYKASCKYGSLHYYLLCGVGGMVACGLTHTALVPVDVVKCRIQVNSKKYPGIFLGFLRTLKEDGFSCLSRGWLPTMIGYSMQGFIKFGCYEYFKNMYSSILDPITAHNFRILVFLVASASAELIADLFLCAPETVKVRMQTQVLSTGEPKFISTCKSIFNTEHMFGFVKVLPALWMRQVPYTMMKFASFERVLEFLYGHVIIKPRATCSKAEQLMISFLAGYIAGVFCAVISQPADTVVSRMNQEKESSFCVVGRQVGFFGLYRGLVARILMIGTLTALQWFIYDYVKLWLKLPHPPLKSLAFSTVRERLKSVAPSIGTRP